MHYRTISFESFDFDDFIPFDIHRITSVFPHSNSYEKGAPQSPGAPIQTYEKLYQNNLYLNKHFKSDYTVIII